MKLGAGAKTVLMLAGITVVLWGLHEAHALLIPLVTAGFITVISLPAVVWLSERGVPRWAAVLVAVLLDLAVLFSFAGLIGNSLNEFYERVPTYQARLAELTTSAALWVDQMGLDVDPETVASEVQRLGLMDIVAGLFQRVWAFGSKALLVALLVLFMLFEAGPWRTKFAYVLQRPTLDLPRFEKAASEVQKYLVVKSGLSVVTGGLCGVWVAVCGVDFPLLWALLAFFLNYIPTLGMFIATIPPVIVALIQFGPGTAILVLAGYLVINFTLGNFVEPRIMGRALGLSPLMVFLSMVFWGLLWGPIGALLAVPLTMVIKILLASTEDLRWAAVLLGSREWLAEKRKEWEDPFEAEKRRSLPPRESEEEPEESVLTKADDALPDSETPLADSPLPAGQSAALAPLHDEDEEQGSGLRPRPGGGISTGTS